jgi:hypothetical protein
MQLVPILPQWEASLMEFLPVKQGQARSNLGAKDLVQQNDDFLDIVYLSCV